MTCPPVKGCTVRARRPLLISEFSDFRRPRDGPNESQSRDWRKTHHTAQGKGAHNSCGSRSELASPRYSRRLVEQGWTKFSPTPYQFHPVAHCLKTAVGSSVNIVADFRSQEANPGWPPRKNGSTSENGCSAVRRLG